MALVRLRLQYSYAVMMVVSRHPGTRTRALRSFVLSVHDEQTVLLFMYHNGYNLPRYFLSLPYLPLVPHACIMQSTHTSAATSRVLGSTQTRIFPAYRRSHVLVVVQRTLLLVP